MEWKYKALWLTFWNFTVSMIFLTPSGKGVNCSTPFFTLAKASEYFWQVNQYLTNEWNAEWILLHSWHGHMLYAVSLLVNNRTFCSLLYIWTCWQLHLLHRVTFHFRNSYIATGLCSSAPSAFVLWILDVWGFLSDRLSSNHLSSHSGK